VTTLEEDSVQIEAAVAEIRARYAEILVILSPPRCTSTALARVFWNQPATRAYLHEPFDICYHRGAGAREALENFAEPMTIREAGHNLVVKEMTFQVRDHVSTLLALTRKPIIFLIRDPRLSIRSRMRKRVQGGQPQVFPEVESGWGDLAAQIRLCDTQKIPYVVVDSTTFRNAPDTVVPALCDRLGLAFSASMLSWERCENLAVGHLGAEQSHWYQRVLESTGIQPATATVPDITTFPDEMRAHIRACVDLYNHFRTSEHLIAGS
jgi:hypothetical protein